jgi:hypothetical protein
LKNIIKTRKTRKPMNKNAIFINKAKLIHGETYGYSNVEYINAHTDVKIICKIHGEFNQRPYAHIGKQNQGCPKC